MKSPQAIYLGIDLGTSGCRALAIDADGRVLGGSRVDLPPVPVHGECAAQEPELWWDAVCRLLRELLLEVPPDRVASLAVDGTSGTVLLTDAAGHPLAPALMYNDARARAEAARLRALAPQESAVHGPTSGLAKLLRLYRDLRSRRPRHALSQADWIAGRLMGRFGSSDDNNSLKLGFDPVARLWPSWLGALDFDPALLPEVHRPGTPLGTVGPEAQTVFGLAWGTTVGAGTTDSTAAVIASGVERPGEAVTSLGSTLVLKVVSESALFDGHWGVYSQPYGEFWLAGGGSNSGGAVLRRYFDDQELERLSRRIPVGQSSGLDYYPLLAPGERFPVNDPNLPPRLSPHPPDAVRFLHGLLEGIARIEAQGYQRLQQLGAPTPTSVRSVGGGARNPAWRAIRERLLGIPLVPARHTEAAYGAALLARRAAASSGARAHPGGRHENPRRL